MILTKYGRTEIDLDLLTDEIIKAGKLNEILFIVPTNRKIRYFKRELISRSPNNAAAGLNLETIGTYCTRMLFGSPDGAPLVSEQTAVVLLKQSFQEAELKYFSNYKDEIPFGTLERVKNVISEYKKNGISPELLMNEAKTLTGAERAKAEDIAAIYKIYQEKFNSIGVKEIGDVYAELNGKPEEEFVKLFNENYEQVKKIIINGFDEFTNPEIEIINSTAELEGIELYVYFDYYKYNPLIFSHLKKCYEKLLKKGFKEVKDLSPAEQTEFINRVKEKLFGKKEKTPDKRFTNRLTEITAFNRENEIELIAKEIKELIVHKNVKPNRICVVFNLIKPYSPVVRDQFTRFGIPFNLTDRLSLSTSPPIIAVINLLEILENDFYYKNIFRALSSRFIRLEQFDLTNLLKASIELKIVSGLRNWRERLKDAITESRYEDESYNEMKRYNVDYEKALEDIEALHTLLKPFEKKMTVKEFLENLNKLIFKLKFHTNLLEGNDKFVETNIKAVTTFMESIEELMTLLSIEQGDGTKLPLKFFLNQIITLSAFGRYNIKEKPGYGVQVTTLNEIRGLKFDYLFIAGLTDGDFPTRYTPEVFFSGSFAKEEIRHQTEERYHFYQTLCSWQKGLYLTHPSNDEKKELVESNFLIEFKNLFEVKTKSAEDYSDTIYSKEELLKYIGESIGKGTEFKLPEDAGIEIEKVKRAIEINNIRIKEPFSESPYTGILTGELNDELKNKLAEFKEKQFSTSQLETYAKCPYQYFAQRVLHLTTLEEPTEEIEALEMGSLLHTILFGFYSTITEKGIKLQGASPEEFKECEEIIFKIAKEKIDKLNLNSALTFYEKEKILGIEGDRRKSLLYKFLVNERDTADGFVPKYFELAFGELNKFSGDKSMAESEFEIEGVKVRGKIDRVDLNENNGTIKVIDYKLSGKKPSREDLKSGLSLQLPLYMYVAKELISAQLNKKFEPSGSVIYSLKYSEKEFGQLPIKLTGKRTPNEDELIEDSREMIEICIDSIKKYTQQIAEGKFNLSVLEDRENKVCKYCDFKSICRIQDVS